jgi:hypothetical protein
MSLPYEHATSGEKALIDLQKTLAKFGCQSFGTATDAERGMTIIHFKWRDRVVKLEASWKGYAAALMRDTKVAAYNHDRRRKLEAKALEQAKVSVCSVLRDWTKAQITAVEAGVMSFEMAFMPHLLLKDGRRVIDAAHDAKLLPSPPDEKVANIK